MGASGSLLANSRDMMLKIFDDSTIQNFLRELIYSAHVLLVCFVYFYGAARLGIIDSRKSPKRLKNSQNE